MDRVLSLQQMDIWGDNETGFDGSENLTMWSSISSSANNQEAVGSTCSIGCGGLGSGEILG